MFFNGQRDILNRQQTNFSIVFVDNGIHFLPCLLLPTKFVASAAKCIFSFSSNSSSSSSIQEELQAESCEPEPLFFSTETMPPTSLLLWESSQLAAGMWSEMTKSCYTKNFRRTMNMVPWNDLYHVYDTSLLVVSFTWCSSSAVSCL